MLKDQKQVEALSHIAQEYGEEAQTRQPGNLAEFEAHKCNACA